MADQRELPLTFPELAPEAPLMPVVRHSKEEFAEELKNVRGLSGRR